MAAVDYYAKPNEPVDPYIGLGVGVQYNIATVDFGIYRFQTDAVPFHSAGKSAPSFTCTVVKE
jgi:hypothetical protein